MTKSRQTQSYLQNLFARRGIAPRHRFGQNFLIDLNLHELIARAADVQPTDVILEVGPGAGALTVLMAESASAVVAVEIDPAMAQLTREAVSGRANVRVIEADALAGKHEINLQVLDNIRAGLAVAPDRRFKLVANLPYNVATPVITNLLIHAEFRPVLLVVTIQLELAERLRAEPATEAYGALSALVQALADVEFVRTLSPKVFWPRPKVASAVVKITPDATKRRAVGDLAWYHEIVRRLFQHRRKNLRGVLHTLWRDHWTKPDVDAFLDELGLLGQVRAEAMNVEELIALAAALKQRFGALPDALTGPDHQNDDRTSKTVHHRGHMGTQS
jgi:16S rRNA (adenine1518-N6/adenine1519-N6)-dimethyltransferase